MPSIRFFSEGVSFKLKHSRKTVRWIKETIAHESCTLGELAFIFCTDEYLMSINVDFLKHHTLTDIITFDHAEENGEISGDIFISVARVKENAPKFDSSFEEELHRVIIHGVLHLIGYSDKSPAQKNQMRKKEDAYLSLRNG